MDAHSAPVRVIRRRCAPKTFPCPTCGRRGRRKDTHTRRVRDIAYGEIVFLDLTVGEYRARCSCCKTFRSQVEGIEPRAEYTNRVREAVINRLLDDGMSLHRLQQALRRDFRLELSDGFLYDCLDWKVRQTDLPAYRQWTATLRHPRTTNAPGPSNAAAGDRPARRFPVARPGPANDRDHAPFWPTEDPASRHRSSPMAPNRIRRCWPNLADARHQSASSRPRAMVATLRRLRRPAAVADGRRRAAADESNVGLARARPTKRNRPTSSGNTGI